MEEGKKERGGEEKRGGRMEGREVGRWRGRWDRGRRQREERVGDGVEREGDGAEEMNGEREGDGVERGRKKEGDEVGRGREIEWRGGGEEGRDLNCNDITRF